MNCASGGTVPVLVVRTRLSPADPYGPTRTSDRCSTNHHGDMILDMVYPA